MPKSLRHEFIIDIYANEELAPKENALIQEAIKAAQNAYAPYSKFKVGAAIRLNNERVIIGNNQENKAFPSGLCAERVAIFNAMALYPEAIIQSIAIYAESEKIKKSEIISPCGACRQVIAEYQQRQKEPIHIWLRNKTNTYHIKGIENLLPLMFDAEI